MTIHAERPLRDCARFDSACRAGEAVGGAASVCIRPGAATAHRSGSRCRRERRGDKRRFRCAGGAGGLRGDYPLPSSRYILERPHDRHLYRALCSEAGSCRSIRRSPSRSLSVRAARPSCTCCGTSRRAPSARQCDTWCNGCPIRRTCRVRSSARAALCHTVLGVRLPCRAEAALVNAARSGECRSAAQRIA